MEDKGQKGQSLVLYALLITILLGAVAFAVDIGRAYAFSNNLQETADAAAMAGDKYLVLVNNQVPCSEFTQALNSAEDTLKANGFSVSPSWSPPSCAGNVNFTGNPASYQVKVPLQEKLLDGKTAVATLDFVDPPNTVYLAVTIPASMNYSFARVLGFSGTTVKRSGIAGNPGQGGNCYSPNETNCSGGGGGGGSLPSNPPSCSTQGVAPEGVSTTMMQSMMTMWQQQQASANPQPVYFTLEPPQGSHTVTGTVEVNGATGPGDQWYRLNLSTESNLANQGYNQGEGDGSSCGQMMGSSGPCGTSNMVGMMAGHGGTNVWDYNLLYGYPGTVAVNNTVNGQPGNAGKNGAKICSERQREAKSCTTCSNNNVQYLTLPVVQYNYGHGSGANYTIEGFCYAKIYNITGNNVKLEFEGNFPTNDVFAHYDPNLPATSYSSIEHTVVLVRNLPS